MGTISTVELTGSFILQGEQVLSSLGGDVSSCFTMLLLVVRCSCSGTGRLSLLPADGVVSTSVAWQELVRVASVLRLGLDSLLLPAAVSGLEGQFNLHSWSLLMDFRKASRRFYQLEGT